jgi:hypothetical protein
MGSVDERKSANVSVAIFKLKIVMLEKCHNGESYAINFCLRGLGFRI